MRCWVSKTQTFQRETCMKVNWNFQIWQIGDLFQTKTLCELWIAIDIFSNNTFVYVEEDYLIQISGKKSIPKSTDMYAKHDKYSLTTDKSQRFYPCLSFSCKYWGDLCKTLQYVWKLSLSTWQSKSDTTFSWWSSCNERCKQCFNSTLHALLHSNGLHDELNCHGQEKNILQFNYKGA